MNNEKAIGTIHFILKGYSSNLRLEEKIISGINEVVSPARDRFFEGDPSWDSGLPEKFLASFNKWPQDQKETNSYILEEWEWRMWFEKAVWRWSGYCRKRNDLVIKVNTIHRGHYLDFIYILIYLGIDFKDIYVKDSIFGNYKLIDTV